MVNEINRILKLFANLQHGECWNGTNFNEVPHGAGAELAIKKNQQKQIVPAAGSAYYLPAYSGGKRTNRKR